MEALLEDIKGQRAVADLQLAAARCVFPSLLVFILHFVQGEDAAAYILILTSVMQSLDNRHLRLHVRCASSAHSALGAGRQEKAAADELVSKAGFEGFRIKQQLLLNLESAVGRAAAAQSDKEQ